LDGPVEGFGGGLNRQRIEEVLRQKMELAYFDIADESAKHFEANDSHFSLIAVAPGFEGQSLIQR
jgi:stress-induced morphogen